MSRNTRFTAFKDVKCSDGVSRTVYVHMHWNGKDRWVFSNHDLSRVPAFARVDHFRPRVRGTVRVVDDKAVEFSSPDLTPEQVKGAA